MTKDKEKVGIGIDLAQFDTVAACNKGAVMEVLDPYTGEPTGASITLAGVDSDVYQKAQRENQDQMFRQMERGRGPRASRLSGDEIQAQVQHVLARCTMAWDGVAWEGRDLDCSYQNARMLYERLPWLRVQVLNWTEDRANFLAK